MRRLNLDTGHYTDEELGINPRVQRSMTERPKAHIARLARMTRNGNLVMPRAR